MYVGTTVETIYSFVNYIGTKTPQSDPMFLLIDTRSINEMVIFIFSVEIKEHN